MSEDILSRAQHLSDLDLLARLKALAQREREATVALIAHLAVLDERRLYLGEGHPSLFAYCTEELHLAEHAPYNRIEAARAGRKFPVILSMLAEGAVTLATVRLLAPHLTPANHADLLAAARGKSKGEVAELVAQLSPKPSVPSTVRMLPTLHREPSPLAIGETTRRKAPPPARPPVVEPLGLRRYRMQFTASAETCDKLRLARDLLRHQIPDGDLGEIFDRALTLLVETLAKQKFAETCRPRERPTGGNGSQRASCRHIPGRSEAYRLAPRRGPMRLCRTQGSPLRCSWLPRAPSPPAPRRRRRSHAGQHPAPLPGSQQIRGGTLLRNSTSAGPSRQ